MECTSNGNETMTRYFPTKNGYNTYKELYHPSDASNEYWGGVMKAKPPGQKKELLCR